MNLLKRVTRSCITKGCSLDVASMHSRSVLVEFVRDIALLVELLVVSSSTNLFDLCKNRSQILKIRQTNKYLKLDIMNNWMMERQIAFQQLIEMHVYKVLRYATSSAYKLQRAKGYALQHICIKCRSGVKQIYSNC